MALHVALLWHMHQPDYVDPVRGIALLPWVRLHATKGYLDMIWLVEQFPELRCTFNLTPILLRQIEQHARGEVRDHWQELARTPADALTPLQQREVLLHFFRANWAHMVRPYPRYWSLLQRRGQHVQPGRVGQLTGHFSTQDYRDLQVWFNLAWFGYAAEELYPELTELRRKGHNFTEEEKQQVLTRQQDILRGLIARYRAAADAGLIEISTSPYFHPILPLVHDTDFARRNLPGCDLPQRFAHPEDVRAQLELARQQHERLFGQPPRGLWPSEGSVCPEIIPAIVEQGFQWMATDEEILWRSLAAEHQDRLASRQLLHQPCQAEFAGARIAVAFRDRTVSDFIGFSAARNEPRRAVDHVLGALHATQDADDLCAIVLDGENAWEHFADGGQAFLRTLYTELTHSRQLKTTTMAGYFAAREPHTTLRALHTGSWIDANFRIWIGHAEDRRAWDLLAGARDAVHAKTDLTPDRRQQAMTEIYAAEGSDWFWWYGDDFSTEDDLIFDELFRIHVQNAYRYANLAVAPATQEPICRSEIVPESHRPTALISPAIDGRVTSYYEWTGAGVYQPGVTGGAMGRSDWLLKALYYGWDLKHLYIRADFQRPRPVLPCDCVRICFTSPSQLVVNARPAGASIVNQVEQACRVEAVWESVLELSLPLHGLGWLACQPVSFSVQLLDGETEIERHPLAGGLSTAVPSDAFDTENWWV